MPSKKGKSSTYDEVILLDDENAGCYLSINLKSKIEISYSFNLFRFQYLKYIVLADLYVDNSFLSAENGSLDGEDEEEGEIITLSDEEKSGKSNKKTTKNF